MPPAEKGLLSKDFKVNAFLLGFATLLMLYPPLHDLFLYSANHEYYSHIFIIPFVGAYLIYPRTRKIILSATCSMKTGSLIMTLALTIYGIGFDMATRLDQNDRSSLLIFSGLLFGIGSFILLFGVKNFRQNFFPLLFLGFMIPLPSLIMERVISFLQRSSAELVNIFFHLTGLVFIRDQFTFHLPGISIEVAKQCSGIRSSIALFITAMLASYLFLDAPWRRAFLLLFILPLVILKNGLRILTLSLLAVYVDERFLTQSFLHSSGGFIFYIPMLLLLGLLLWILRKQEKSRKSPMKLQEPIRNEA